jgi:plastocyanin
MSNNREFSQLASYVEVSEGNNSIGIATGGTQSVGIATTSITFEGTTGYINAKGFYKNGVEVAPVSSGTLGVWETTAAGINTTSNVGIGSTIPTAKLDVDGHTELDDVNVSGAITATTLNITNKLTSTGIGISVANGTGNTATITGPSNLIIDPAAVGDNTGTVRIKGDFMVDGTTTTVNSTTVEIADKVIGVGTTCNTDLLTDGAGIGIGSDKTFLYEHNSGTNPSLKASENLNVPTGKGYQVNQTEVLNATTLGSNVVNSSLTNLGTLTNLNVSGIVTANSLDAAISEWTLGASGTDHYTFTGPGLTGAENDPSIYLTRGQKYRFKNSSGGHPFRIQSDPNGSAGTAYSDGVTNNDAGDGVTLEIDVQFDAPDILYYQCTSHNNMGGKIYIGNSGESISVGDAVTINSEGIDVNGIATIRGGTHYLNFNGATAPQIRVEGSSDVLAFKGNGHQFLNGAGNANIAKFEDTFHEFYISGDVNPKAKIISTGISLVGVVTALSGIVTYYGDGSNLTGISAGGGDGGDFNTGITTTEHSVASNNIDGYTAIGVTFPTTASKRHYIESIHVTNISNSDLYLTSRIDYNGGQDVPLTHRVLIPYQGALEILDEALIANPSDNLRFAAYTGIGTTAGGVSNGLDCWVSYETKDGTDYVGIGSTVPSTNEETIFTSSNANGTIINTIQLTNYAFNVDVDVSVSLHDGSIRQGYFVKNLTVPQNSSIQILPKVKKVANGDSIKVQAGIANAISVNIAGKNI